MGAGLEETVKNHAAKLTRDFGSVVRVKYIDTTREGMDKFPELKKIVAAGYSFPITSINGEARLAGDVVYEDIKDLIEETLAE